MFQRKGVNAREETISFHARVAITRAQTDGTDAIFHGSCIGCIWKLNNAWGEGLRWCKGCAYFNFTDHLPNRRIGGADSRDLALDDDGIDPER